MAIKMSWLLVIALIGIQSAYADVNISASPNFLDGQYAASEFCPDVCYAHKYVWNGQWNNQVVGNNYTSFCGCKDYSEKLKKNKM